MCFHDVASFSFNNKQALNIAIPGGTQPAEYCLGYREHCSKLDKFQFTGIFKYYFVHMINTDNFSI